MTTLFGASVGVAIAIVAFGVLLTLAPIAIWIHTARTAKAVRALVDLYERQLRATEDAHAALRVAENQRANAEWKRNRAVGE